MPVPRLKPQTSGYEVNFRADYQCMKCGHKVYSKHPVSLSKCPSCGKNSWRRYQRPEEETAVVKKRAVSKNRLTSP